MDVRARVKQLRESMKLAHVSSADIRKSDSTCPNSNSMEKNTARYKIMDRQINETDLKISQSQNQLSYNRKVFSGSRIIEQPSEPLINNQSEPGTLNYVPRFNRSESKGNSSLETSPRIITSPGKPRPFDTL